MEDDDLLRGRAQFASGVRIPGQLEAYFVRSTVARGKVALIDSAAAKGRDGVVAIFTSIDAPLDPLPPFLWSEIPQVINEEVRPIVRDAPQAALAGDEVRYVGEPVAMIIGRTRSAVEDAAEAVVVEYDECDAVTSIEDALAGSNFVYPQWGTNVVVDICLRTGDVEAGLRSGTVVVQERFVFQRQAGVPLEPRVVVASFEDNGSQLRVWASSQNVHRVRRALGLVLGIPEARIRVQAPAVGGGFGTKGVLYPEDIMVPWAAWRLGAPVRWVEERSEHMVASIHARDQVHNVMIVGKRDGTFVGLRDSFAVDAGAYTHLGMAIPYNTATHLSGPYKIPALEARGIMVVTNRTPTAPYRGAGRPEAVFAVERIIDRLARALSRDPLELRMQNLLSADEIPYVTGLRYRTGEKIVLDLGDVKAQMTRAANGLSERRAEHAESCRKRSPHLSYGVGYAAYTEGTGVGPFEGAEVEVDEAGRIWVFTGSASQGQGHKTVFAQICAEAFDVPLERVEVVEADTDKIRYGWGTIASRSAVVAGSAVTQATDRVRNLALAVGADMLEVAEADVELVAGAVRVVGVPSRSVFLGDIASAAGPDGTASEHNDGLRAVEYFRPESVTWASGAHAALVELDTETGAVRVLEYVVVHDCGVEINPTIVEGQVMGGVAQGIGSALFEEIVYDQEGQVRSGNLLDYLIPGAPELPSIRVIGLMTPSGRNPLGVKGVGEGGAIGPPAAIANAVEDALIRSGRPTAIVHQLPLTPQYVASLVLAGGEVKILGVVDRAARAQENK